MVRRLVSARDPFKWTLLLAASVVLAMSCEDASNNTEMRRASLVGDPTESVQQIQGVAPVSINLTFFPVDSQSVTALPSQSDCSTKMLNSAVSIQAERASSSPAFRRAPLVQSRTR